VKLRYFVTCSEHGVKDDPVLQYWDTEIERWQNIPWVECKDWEEEEYLVKEEIY